MLGLFSSLTPPVFRMLQWDNAQRRARTCQRFHRATARSLRFQWFIGGGGAELRFASCPNIGSTTTTFRGFHGALLDPVDDACMIDAMVRAVPTDRESEGTSGCFTMVIGEQATKSLVTFDVANHASSGLVWLDDRVVDSLMWAFMKTMRTNSPSRSWQSRRAAVAERQDGETTATIMVASREAEARERGAQSASPWRVVAYHRRSSGC